MSLEMNKIAAAVLTAGIVAMGSGFVAETMFHEEHLAENAYPVEVAEKSGDGGEAAAPAGPEPVLPLLADASASAGEKQIRACASCHSFEKGGANKVGPNLYGIVGAPVGGDGSFNYSQAFMDKNAEGATWTYENLNHFLWDPKDWVPGTKMGYAGMSSAQDRADLIAYLRENDDDPAPLPTDEEIAAVQQSAEEEAGGEEAASEEAASEEAAGEGAEGESGMAAGGDGGDSFPHLVAAADPADGEKAVRACQACHSFNKGGPNKVGPNLYNIVGQPVASAEGYSYSSAFQAKADEGVTWSYDELSAFLEDPKGWAPGTKMSYAGVSDAEKRAAMVAYLRSQSENPPPLPEDGDATPEGGGEADTEAAGDSESSAAEEATQTTAAEATPEGGGEADADADGGGLDSMIAAASADAAESATRVCSACHTFDKGGANRVGPNLYNILGGPIAADDSFSYSDALKKKAESGATWTHENLDAWLKSPQDFAPGNKMGFPGASDPEKRAAMIKRMRMASDNPPPLGE